MGKHIRLTLLPTTLFTGASTNFTYDGFLYPSFYISNDSYDKAYELLPKPAIKLIVVATITVPNI